MVIIPHGGKKAEVILNYMIILTILISSIKVVLILEHLLMKAFYCPGEHIKIEAYDGRFENIDLTLEPVPIPQSFWLLCSGSILILLYARRQVMA